MCLLNGLLLNMLPLTSAGSAFCVSTVQGDYRQLVGFSEMSGKAEDQTQPELTATGLLDKLIYELPDAEQRGMAAAAFDEEAKQRLLRTYNMYGGMDAARGFFKRQANISGASLLTPLLLLSPCITHY